MIFPAKNMSPHVVAHQPFHRLGLSNGSFPSSWSLERGYCHRPRNRKQQTIPSVSSKPRFSNTDALLQNERSLSRCRECRRHWSTVSFQFTSRRHCIHFVGGKMQVLVRQQVQDGKLPSQGTQIQTSRPLIDDLLAFHGYICGVNQHYFDHSLLASPYILIFSVFSLSHTYILSIFRLSHTYLRHSLQAHRLQDSRLC